MVIFVPPLPLAPFGGCAAPAATLQESVAAEAGGAERGSQG